MPYTVIQEIKSYLKQPTNLTHAQVTHLHELLDELVEHVDEISKNDQKQAQHIISLAKNKLVLAETQEKQVQNFEDLLYEFDAKYPRFSHTMRRIGSMLSSLGI